MSNFIELLISVYGKETLKENISKVKGYHCVLDILEEYDIRLNHNKNIESIGSSNDQDKELKKLKLELDQLQTQIKQNDISNYELQKLNKNLSGESNEIKSKYDEVKKEVELKIKENVKLKKDLEILSKEQNTNLDLQKEIEKLKQDLMSKDNVEKKDLELKIKENAKLKKDLEILSSEYKIVSSSLDALKLLMNDKEKFIEEQRELLNESKQLKNKTPPPTSPKQELKNTPPVFEVVVDGIDSSD